MGALVDFAKLAELRAKTDRDLARILQIELDRALALANVAASRHSVFQGEAESIRARAKKLLPKLAGPERPQLEHKLKELEMALDLAAGTIDLAQEPVCC